VDISQLRLQGEYLDGFSRILRNYASTPIPPDKEDDDDWARGTSMATFINREQFYTHVIHSIEAIPDIKNTGLTWEMLEPIITEYKPSFWGSLKKVDDDDPRTQPIRNKVTNERGIKNMEIHELPATDDPDKLDDKYMKIAILYDQKHIAGCILGAFKECLAVQPDHEELFEQMIKWARHRYDDVSMQEIGREYVQLAGFLPQLTDDIRYPLMEAQVEVWREIFEEKLRKQYPNMGEQGFKIMVQEKLGAIAREAGVWPPNHREGRS